MSFKDQLSEFIASGNNSKVNKLTIKSYALADQAETIGKVTTVVSATTKENSETFIAYYNPATFSTEYAIEYQDDQLLGDTKISALFNKYTTTTYGFDLLIDGTYASIPDGWKEKIDVNHEDHSFVDQQIKIFKRVAYDYNSETHRPNFLSLEWGGTLVPRCVLTTLGISYELFARDGYPLRAKLTCKFKEFSTEKLKKAEKKSESPDMTHIRTVQQGDKLPLMCERIYGDAKLYLEVARFNGLTNYRNLKPGQQLYFPPLIASKS